MMTPLVSVIVDTYNHESFIETAIASVLDQDIGRAAFEVVVVDDGSTDRTPSILEKFGADVRLVRKANGGQASAFNAGIPLTSAPIVAFLDGDDWWENNKLSTVVEVLESDRALGAVGHGIFEWRDDRNVRRISRSDVTLNLRSSEDIVPFLYHRSFLGTSRFTARRWLLDTLTPIPEGLVFEADEYLFTLAAAATPIRVVETPLTYYRLHENNLFHFSERDPIRQARKYEVMSVLGAELRSGLRKLGVPNDVIDDLLLPNEVDSERMRLALFGGHRRETLRTERAGRRVARVFGAPSRPIVAMAAQVLAAVLSPRRFYRLRDRYARARARADRASST